MAELMIIDDTGGPIAAVAGKLRQLGHRVRISGPKGALDGDIEAHRPDAALLNLQLRDVAGWHVLTQMKIRYPQLPVGLIYHREGDLYDERLHMAECTLGAVNLRLEKLDGLVRMLLRRREYSGKATPSVPFGRPVSPVLSDWRKATP